MSDDENNGDWEWENAGFGKKREPLNLPMEIGMAFEDVMEEMEEAQKVEVEKDEKESENRRKLMEKVTVQTAQFQLLWGKNQRALQKKKEFKYYEVPRIFLIRPVMSEEMISNLLAKNQEILNQMTEYVAKNEKLADMDSKTLVDFANE